MTLMMIPVLTLAACSSSPGATHPMSVQSPTTMITSADADVPATTACDDLYQLAQAWRTTKRTPPGLVTEMAAAASRAAKANARVYSSVAEGSAALAQLVNSAPSNHQASLLNSSDVATMQQACSAAPLKRAYFTLPTD